MRYLLGSLVTISFEILVMLRHGGLGVGIE